MTEKKCKHLNKLVYSSDAKIVKCEDCHQTWKVTETECELQYWRGYEDGMQSGFKHMKNLAKWCEKAHNKKNRLIGK